MTKFEFTAAIAIRAYGTITVKADTLDAAKAKISEPNFDMEEAFEVHGGGDDDYDYNYERPAIYLEDVSVDGEEPQMLDEDLPDTLERSTAKASVSAADDTQTFAFLIAWGRNVAEAGTFSWSGEAANYDEAVAAAYAEMSDSAEREIDQDDHPILMEWQGWNPWADPRETSGEKLEALRIADGFMSGFEGDEAQNGIDAKLATIRAAIKDAEISKQAF